MLKIKKMNLKFVKGKSDQCVVSVSEIGDLSEV